MAAVVNCKNTVKRNITKGQFSCNEIIPVILWAVNSSKKWQIYFLLKVFQGFPRLVSYATNKIAVYSKEPLPFSYFPKRSANGNY